MKKEKVKKSKKLKLDKKMVEIIIMIIVSIILVTCGMIYFIKLITPTKKDLLYDTYVENNNFNCSHMTCVSNELKFEDNSEYTYVETVNLKEETYNFDIKTEDNRVTYNGNYKIENNLIEIKFNIDNIEFNGTYDINKKFISLTPICENCSIDDYQNIYDNYRDDAYNTSMILVNQIINIVDKDLDNY